MYKSKKLATAVSLVLAGGCYSASAVELEEIVVTAQKRSENLQDVPIAVYAVTGDDIESLSASNLQSLTEHIAGAELFDDRGAGQPTWVIRGVGLADFNSNNTPTAAIYYDEYYLTSNVLGGIGMFDIERVEVLKGPQGGLYGRNTSGGAVRVASRAPEVGGGLMGHLSGSFGRWEKHSLDGAIGFDISDKAAARVAAVSHQGGGWQDSLATEEDDEWGDSDFFAFRAQVAVELSDTTELLVKVDSGKDESETTLGLSSPIWDENFEPCADALAGIRNSGNCVTLGNITNNWVWTPGDTGPTPSDQDFDGSTVLGNPINKLDNDWQGVTVRLDSELSFATFTSITGYLTYDNNQTYDYDASSLVLLQEETSSELTSWSQEFRLVSNSTGDLTWQTGLMIAHDEVDERRHGSLAQNALIYWSEGIRSFEQESDSWAVYTEVKYQIADDVSIGGSLRYTDENKDLIDYTHLDLNPFEFVPVGGEFYYVQDVNKDYELDENLSGHIGIDWTVTDDVLVYGKITRGFKSGGFYGGFAFSEPELDPYREEIVWSYEVGLKSELFDRTLRLNAAAYFYDYQDVQGFTQTISQETGTALTKLGNMGDAEHTGAELEMLWIPQFAEGLSVQLGLSWMEAKIVDSDEFRLDPINNGAPMEGLSRGQAPKWSGSLQLRYETNVSNYLLGSAQLNYSWRDDLFGTDSLITPIDKAANYFEGYDLVNIRFALASQEHPSWEVSLTGKNLANEEYSTRVGGDDLLSYTSIPGRPRSWELGLRYDF